MIYLTIIDYTHALDHDESIDHFLTTRHLSAAETNHLTESIKAEKRKNPDIDSDDLTEIGNLYLQAIGIYLPYVFSGEIKLPML